MHLENYWQNQRVTLYYSGKTQRDVQTLRDCNIEEGSTLRLVLKDGASLSYDFKLGLNYQFKW